MECQYEMLQEFCLPGQIGSVASVKCFYGLIASQPAGGCAVLPVQNQESRENIKQQVSVIHSLHKEYYVH